MVRSRRQTNNNNNHAANNGRGGCTNTTDTAETREFDGGGVVVYPDHLALGHELAEKNGQYSTLSIDQNDDYDHDEHDQSSVYYDDDDEENDDHDNNAMPMSNSRTQYSPSTLLSSGNRYNIYTPQLFTTHPHLAVLPVILLEFLSLAITRAVLPSLLLQRYGSKTYIVMGLAECVRGILAFLTCPLFGKLSDIWGRRPCLLLTVLGTLAPVCSLAFWKVNAAIDLTTMQGEAEENILYASSTILNEINDENILLDGVDAGGATEGQWYSPNLGTQSTYNNMDPSSLRIDVFVILLALSGMCSSTFTLTFAYISDVVKDRDGRVAAYGLALATFGLSFTIGPLLGGYLANVDNQGHGHGGRNWMRIFHLDDGNEANDATVEPDTPSIQQFGSKNSDIHPLGQHRVFLTSLCLALLDLFYIHFLLPESLNSKKDEMEHASTLVNVSIDDGSDSINNAAPSSMAVASTSGMSNVTLPAGVGVSRRASSSWWNPFDSVRYLTRDPLLSTIGRITFFYYTALHAVVSTLILYATRQFHLGPQRLGELMAALGLSTMVSEAVLVRIAIPLFGETCCMRIGLISFTLQCVLLAMADRPWQLFICAFLAMGGNLVYPSVSSLVSSSVRPDMVGRALGAVNGVKSLTEGIGPLIFGTVSSFHC